MSRKYTNAPTECCAEQVDRPKDLKKRIKESKGQISTLVDFTDRGIIDYECGIKIIGYRYIELYRLKDRLKRFKNAR